MSYRFDFGALLPYWRALLEGCWQTLWMTSVSVACGLTIGLITMIIARSQIRPLRWIAMSYIEIVRNTPFLVQVLFIYFGLPALGVNLDPWFAAILALSLNCGAYSAEIIRGGVDGIGGGQFEAGAVLGLSPLQTLRYVILKPALRVIFPSLSSQFILALLTSSIVSSISVDELTAAAEQIGSDTFRSFEAFISATLLYLLMSLLFSFFFKSVDRIAFRYPQ